MMRHTRDSGVSNGTVRRLAEYIDKQGKPRKLIEFSEDVLTDVLRAVRKAMEKLGKSDGSILSRPRRGCVPDLGLRARSRCCAAT